MKLIKKKGIKKIDKKLQAEIRGGTCSYAGYTCDEYHIVIVETGRGEGSADSLTRRIRR